MAKDTYKSTRLKLPKLFEKTNENERVIDGELKKIKIDYHQVNNCKKLSRIKIAEVQLGPQVGSSHESLAFHIEFENFPEKMIPYVRLVQYFTVDDAYDMNNLWATSTENMQYWWEKKLNGGMALHGRVFHSSPRVAIVDATVFNVPIYHTVELIIQNEGTYNEIQGNAE